MQVLHHVTWPHKCIYAADRQPTEYKTLSVPLFVSGYVKVMDTETLASKSLVGAHLADLMADAELYVWEAGRAFHAIWLQQIEQGHASWLDFWT